MMNARSCRIMLFCGALSVIVSAVSTGAASAPSRESVKVEFHCKIVKPLQESDQELDQWVVQIKGAAGEILSAETVQDGQTARFKGLEPGIYSVCVFGSFNRRHCESIDMYPPVGRSSYKISRDFEAPSSLLNRSDMNKVSLGDLVVPQAAHDELARAELARSRDQIQEAIDHLEEALRIFPDYSDALNNLGSCYFQIHEFLKSEECFTKVTQLNPEFYGGWVNLSSSLISLSRFGEAFEASKHAYEMLPQEPIVIGYYAKSLYYLHKFDAARKQFEILERMDPGNQSYPQLFLAQIALVKGDIATARQYVKEFLQLHPNNPEARQYRSFLKDIESISTSPS
jgi:tetratricopeptide (TPR) repeat protein